HPQVRSVPADQSYSAPLGASSDRGESESVAAKPAWFRAWADPHSSHLASFAGGIDHAPGVRRNRETGTRHVVHVQFIFRSYFAFAALWILRNELSLENSFRLHVLNHFGHGSRRFASHNQIEISRGPIALHANFFDRDARHPNAARQKVFQIGKQTRPRKSFAIDK